MWKTVYQIKIMNIGQIGQTDYWFKPQMAVCYSGFTTGKRMFLGVFVTVV